MVVSHLNVGTLTKTGNSHGPICVIMCDKLSLSCVIHASKAGQGPDRNGSTGVKT